MEAGSPSEVGVTLEMRIPPLAPFVRYQNEGTDLAERQAHRGQHYEAGIDQTEESKCQEGEEVHHVARRNARVDPHAVVVLAGDHAQTDLAVFTVIAAAIVIAMVKGPRFVHRVDSTNQKTCKEKSLHHFRRYFP